ncbi:Hsp70 family protein [Gordonia sp. DT218]|uniref:Hsp70 family protein n=1 Tax=Gordonia sp. DT218 TaxID=3416659 RepID=UPI003CED1444
MSPSAWTLAIDFGTSNSAAAHSGATSRAVEPLSLSHASHLMPSSVYVASPDNIFVGDSAINQAQQDPAGFVASPKRLITGKPTIIVNGMALQAHVLVTAVMQAIINRGKAAHSGEPPSHVVLTHPEGWAGQHKRILVDGAIHAGIDPTRIITISEPRAAAAHYSRSHSLDPGSKIAVFDFGGGTLDIAVLTVTEDHAFSVIAARGDNGLGGKNFDALVQQWVDERLDERDPNLVDWLRRQAPPDVTQALQQSIRTAKELLSEAPSATITVPGPAGRVTLQITRDEFEELIRPAIDRAMSLTKATLLDAGITHPGQLTSLYLTGGSSRIPLIQQRLGELGSVATLDDPKTVVAQGALVTALAEAAPTTSQQAAMSPSAGELMPSWQQGQDRRPTGASPTPAGGQPAQTPVGQAYGRRVGGPEFAGHDTAAAPSANRSGRRWGLVGGIAVAVIAIIGITVGVITMSGDDNGGDETPPTAANAASAAGNAADATGKDGGRIITDETQLVAALPGALQQQLGTCNKSGFDSNDALEMNCQIKDGSSLAELGKSTGFFISFSVDDNKAAGRIVAVRNGTYSDGKGTLVEDSGRTAAADIDSAMSGSTDNYNIDYASTATGLNMTVFGLNSIADAKAFLSRSGLIS